jgi:hypothetical protein
MGLELRAYILIHSPSPFCNGYIWDRVSQTICPGWLWTTIFLISAYWVARITGVSHSCPTWANSCRGYLAVWIAARDGDLISHSSDWHSKVGYWAVCCFFSWLASWWWVKCCLFIRGSVFYLCILSFTALSSLCLKAYFSEQSLACAKSICYVFTKSTYSICQNPLRKRETKIKQNPGCSSRS